MPFKRLLILLTLAPRLQAQQITTDRPTFTNSSAVVTKGAFQMENGFLDTGGQRKQILDFPESLIRVGVGENTELRFTTPDYYRNAVTGDRQSSGFGDLSLGVKHSLGSVLGLQVAAMVTLSFPYGRQAISSGGYDPSLQLPWSRKLSPKWTAAGMLSLYIPTQNGFHTVLGESTFLVTRQLTKVWDASGEYAGDFPASAGPRHFVQFGTAYKLSARQQLDFHVGARLAETTPTRFVGLGYSFLVAGKH